MIVVICSFALSIRAMFALLFYFTQQYAAPKQCTRHKWGTQNRYMDNRMDAYGIKNSSVGRSEKGQSYGSECAWHDFGNHGFWRLEAFGVGIMD